MKNKTKKEPKPGFIRTFRDNLRVLGIIRKEFPGFLGISALRSLWECAIPYVLAYFSAQIVNELAGAQDPDRLKWLVLLALTVTAACGFLHALSGAIINWKYESVAWQLYSYIPYRKFLTLDYADVDNTEVRDLAERIYGNLNWNGWGIGMTFGRFNDLICHLFRIAGAVLLSVTFFTLKVPEGSSLAWLNNPLILSGLLVLMCAVTFLSPVFHNIAQGYWARRAATARKVNNSFGYFLFTLLEKVYAADFRIYRLDRMAAAAYQPENPESAFGYRGPFARLARGPMGISHGVGALFAVLFTGLAYALVCLKAWAGAYPVGSIAQYVAAITGLSQGINGLVSSYGLLRTNATFLKPLFELLDREETMYKGSLTTEKRADRDFELEFRDVSFKYPSSDTYALRHVSLKFKIGERLALVGMNGSGKTTFIKLLCRLYDPTEGEILLNGIDIRKYRYDEYIRIFSVVFQDFKLLPFSLAENVASGEAPDEKRLSEALTAVELDGEKFKPDTILYKDVFPTGVDISGGEAQKIALARAVYRDAPFVILDEPTSALDPLAEAAVYESFDKIIKDRTAVYISHRLSSCRFCDRIAVFDNGQVKEVGTHEKLVADVKSKYHALWFAQAQYYTK